MNMSPNEQDSEHSLPLNSAAISEQYRDKIYRYILRLVHDPSDADDLTQETFLRVHRKLETLQDPATVSTWIYRIATNICYDRFRQKSRQPVVSVQRDEDTDTEPEDTEALRLDQYIDREDMGNCIREFMEGLSDSYRTVIMLHDLHGMTNPEIAETLACSLHTVKIRLHRARQRLKDALARGCNFSHDDRGVFVCERKLPEA
jgi:RNA polymerase sigma-70 factor (ECF subfamily)